MCDSKQRARIKIVGLFIAMLMLSGCSQIDLPTAEQMLINMAQSFPSIWKMLTAFSYILGMAFIMRGVYSLKVYGEMRSMMSQGPSLKTPLTLLTIGAALMFSPSSFHIIMNSTFGYPEAQPLIGYPSGSGSLSGDSLTALLQLIQLVGVISFIRGWVILANSGNAGSQNSVGKALTHIIGGILAINIEGTTQMLEATFGIG